MKLKNLDPLSGYKQLIRGYFVVPRILVMGLLKEEKISPTLLGYVLICLVAADWETKPTRRGFIRQDLSELAKAVGVSKTALYSNLKKL